MTPTTNPYRPTAERPSGPSPPTLHQPACTIRQAHPSPSTVHYTSNGGRPSSCLLDIIRFSRRIYQPPVHYRDVMRFNPRSDTASISHAPATLTDNTALRGRPSAETTSNRPHTVGLYYTRGSNQHARAPNAAPHYLTNVQLSAYRYKSTPAGIHLPQYHTHTHSILHCQTDNTLSNYTAMLCKKVHPET